MEALSWPPLLVKSAPEKAAPMIAIRAMGRRQDGPVAGHDGLDKQPDGRQDQRDREYRVNSGSQLASCRLA